MTHADNSRKQFSDRVADTSHVSIKERLIEGDTSVWEDLNDRYKDAVVFKLSFLNRSFAEDAWQETVQKLLRNPSLFPDGLFPEEKYDDDIRRWLYTVARRKLLDLIRKNKTYRETQVLDESAVEDEQPSRSSVLNDMIRSEESHDLNDAINHLDDKYRIIIQMRYLKGKTFVDIAHRLGILPETIRQRHVRAKAQLSTMLCGGEE